MLRCYAWDLQLAFSALATPFFFRLSGSTLTLRGPIPAIDGKMCDNSCSALSSRTLPFGFVWVQPSFSLWYLCTKPRLVEM